MARNRDKEKKQSTAHVDQSEDVMQKSVHNAAESKSTAGGTTSCATKKSGIMRCMVPLFAFCFFMSCVSYFIARYSSEMYVKMFNEHGKEQTRKVRKTAEEEIDKIKSHSEKQLKKVESLISSVDRSVQQLEQTIVKNLDTMESDAMVDRAMRFRIVDVAFNIKHRICNGLGIKEEVEQIYPISSEFVKQSLDEVSTVSQNGISSNKDISHLIHEIISLCNDMAATSDHDHISPPKEDVEDTWEKRFESLIKVTVDDDSREKSVESEHQGKHYNHSFYRAVLYEADKAININQPEKVSVMVDYLLRYHSNLAPSGGVREVIKGKISTKLKEVQAKVSVRLHATSIMDSIISSVIG